MYKAIKRPKNVHETPKRKSSTITVCHNPYDYYRPGKSRRIEDTRISPAHQSPVNLSATCSRHLAPVGFMSQSTAIVQQSAVANLHQSSFRDLSFKPCKSFESRSIGHTPHPLTFKLGSNLDTFTSLTLKDRLLSKKISGMTQKQKFDTRSRMTGKSTSENLQRMIQPESKKIKLKMSNAKQSQEVLTVTSQKGVNKLKLY